jgi:hypothetical protein
MFSTSKWASFTLGLAFLVGQGAAQQALAQEKQPVLGKLSAVPSGPPMKLSADKNEKDFRAFQTFGWSHSQTGAPLAHGYVYDLDLLKNEHKAVLTLVLSSDGWSTKNAALVMRLRSGQQGAILGDLTYTFDIPCSGKTAHLDLPWDFWDDTNWAEVAIGEGPAATFTKC